MVQATREAHSDKKRITREDVLKLIPRLEIPSLFRREHLQREVIIGLIGLRGDGKSGSGATISLVDHLLRNEPVWSNMTISCEIEIEDDIARKYGLKKGGVVKYESEGLEKDALLKLDERYKGGFIYIDEINVEYSNVRRFMTNTNVDFNTVIQELRKFKSSLGYSVIDEMFIDSQLRTMTDIFIKSEDTALSVEGLDACKPTGEDFKWIIYPMSGYLVGRENSYYSTKKPLPPVWFHFKKFRGIYDTDLFQRKKGAYSAKTKDGKNMNAEITIEPSKDVENTFDEWGWLPERIQILKHAGFEYIEAYQMWQILQVADHHKLPNQMAPILATFGITKHHQNNVGNWVYKIPIADLNKIETLGTV